MVTTRGLKARAARTSWRPPEMMPAAPSRVELKTRPAPVRHEQSKAPVESKERITSEIPTSQFARIRA
jgi:hypothetical protein